MFGRKKLGVKKLYDDAKLLEKAHEDDAAFDVFSYETKLLVPGQRYNFKLGVAVQIPKGHCLLMMPRSGLSVKKGLGVLANVIDAGYTGEIHAVLVNHSNESVEINQGDKVAQVLLLPVPACEVVPLTELEETDRGDKGFGSSGS